MSWQILLIRIKYLLEETEVRAGETNKADNDCRVTCVYANKDSYARFSGGVDMVHNETTPGVEDQTLSQGYHRPCYV